jgi:(1->4)-alpha-D-glucan 1-alpha-D-glucosylmutase
VNGLAQTLLKLTVPGVPDIYQGAEFWDLSMVDPDNRRPVDFTRRFAAMNADASPIALSACWRDGRVKQAVIHRALTVRREVPELFARGEYRPVEVSGPLAAHVVAFLRSRGDALCIVVVPRLPGRLLGQPDAANGTSITIPAEVWQSTTLHLPEDVTRRQLRDRIGNRRRDPLDRHLSLETILADFPVALLTAE